MKILIVDDDYLVSSSLKIILEAEPSFEVPAIGKDALKPYHFTRHSGLMYSLWISVCPK